MAQEKTIIPVFSTIKVDSPLLVSPPDMRYDIFSLHCRMENIERKFHTALNKSPVNEIRFPVNGLLLMRMCFLYIPKQDFMNMELMSLDF